MNMLKFKLKEESNNRTVVFTVTVGDTIDAYVNAFESFLLAVGFEQITVDKALKVDE